jgi:predicted phage-related endonuclease
MKGNVMVGKLTPNDQLSASEMPVLMGASRFMTVNELLKQKMDVINGIEPPFTSNESMDWGNKLEAMILNEAAVRLGLGNPKTNHDKAYPHQTLPFACSLDGSVRGNGQTIMTDIDKGVICANADEIVMEGDGILEAKLTAHEIESANELPLYRGVLQLQMQMDTYGAKWGAVCVLYKGTTLKVFVYQRDEEVIARMHEAIKDFQRRLNKYKTNDEVEWYDIQDTREAASIFDDADKTEIDLSNKEDMIKRIIELREMMADLEEQEKKLQVDIMNEMRDHAYGIAGDYKVTWTTINYKATPEKIIPAKPARVVRASKLRIRELGNG